MPLHHHPKDGSEGRHGSRPNRSGSAAGEQEQSLPWPAFEPGQYARFVTSQGIQRRYIMYVPGGYNHTVKAPLWLAFPGTADSPEGMIAQTGMTDYAGKHTIILAALQGIDLSFNVEAHSQAAADRPDDVQYTQDVLRDVTRVLHVDWQHIHCLGFSRGARMCSRLASELSNHIASIAPVSGLRFPAPNNATRPIPIIAFHGTKDGINPFYGHGAGYWTMSIPQTIHKWVIHNGCRTFAKQKINRNVDLFKHSGCHGGADVFLAQVVGGGHTWPGSNKPTTLGFVSHSIAATVDIGNFFKAHPLWEKCGPAKPGSACHNGIDWARTHGIYLNPGWYPNLGPHSSFEAFQEYFHWNFYSNCMRPCKTTTSTSTWTETKSSTTTTSHTTTTSTSTRSTSTKTTVTISTTTTTTTTTNWDPLRWMGRLENLQVWGADNIESQSSGQGGSAVHEASKTSGRLFVVLVPLLAGAGCVGFLACLVWNRRQSLHNGFLQLGDPEMLSARTRLSSE
eukprot:CAMPEP_0172686206 /NCGR_PEP_ID=MMETSP1074-20121228/20767_1 /TAXON_ID=2916 /ORGANISM="Ceratium fusus, Strain PA161109" /LENGTH=507 /DNA_ID=CAMNT_0013505473 /DNA_START=207 /DNA_END=1730 /DNA_ORIENTATION=+